MITLKDIALAINKRLKEVLPEIEINSKDIKEGFKRPSFFVDFESGSKQQLTRHQVERMIHIIVYYFPKNPHQYKLEILNIQELVEDAFRDELVITDDIRLYTNEISNNVVDGVLQLSFDIHYLEINDPARHDSELPFMEILQYKG
ncbi:phage tail terminator family protein [Paenibacillus aquistagni]|uniref:Phage protein n=1 Tax=Paenibacillus aquistagni TaxID=1852522 RepID=A0A1X7LWC9_9BACL|nr:hypothetical protein [Paenibacillus aquistagni]NMM52151.1 hypothetical protein [Paenibacillus aquistagni]SMG58206.1 hypothetical protein SAMN06295960_4646 [Paenibacillus aquistagni]